MAENIKKQQSPVLEIDTIAMNIENMLKENGTWDDVLQQLRGCKTDYERLKVVLDIPKIDDHIVASHRVVVQKSREKAEEFRTTGNEFFKSSQYEKALFYYSKAVRFAPPPSHDNNSNMLALCFGNRSAAFFHLKQFRSCLVDIENAIEACFPASSLHKLLDRKGKCCLFLKQKQAAIAAFEEAKGALVSEAGLHDKARQDLVRLTDQFIAKCKALPDRAPEPGPEELVHEALPQLGERSIQIPCAAECLVLRSDEERGRGLYAVRDIKVGEVLIVERPFSSVVLPDHHLTHCHQCCCRCFVPLPCEECVDAVFCSVQCRQAAAQENHGIECGLLSQFHSADVRLGHLAYRMVAKAGYRYLTQHRDALECPEEDPSLLGLDDKGLYDSENYATMYHLVGHGDQRQVKDIWMRTVKAAFLVRCLEQTDFFSPMDSDNESVKEKRRADICYIGGHILRHLMMLPCNAHEVSEMGVNWEEPSQSQTLEIGSAIYPVLSLINHSCDPSVVRHSYGNVCVVRAIRGISAGEELFDNYGALYPVMDKAQRQAHLRGQYYFTCQCQACTCKWPMYMELPKDVMQFYCERCRGPVPVPGILQASRTESMACAECGRRQNIRSLILKVGGLEQGFQDALHKVIFALDVGGDTLPRLVQFLRVVDTHVHRPVSCHNDCQEAVKMCYAYKANAFPRRKLPAR